MIDAGAETGIADTGCWDAVVRIPSSSPDCDEDALGVMLNRAQTRDLAEAAVGKIAGFARWDVVQRIPSCRGRK